MQAGIFNRNGSAATALGAVLAGLLASNCISTPSREMDGEWLLRTTFEETCVPVIVDGEAISDVATRTAIQRDESLAGVGASAHDLWETPAGFGKIQVLPENGCRASFVISTRNDDADELRDRALAVLAARGIDFGEGVSRQGRAAGRPMTAYCSHGAPAYCLSIGSSEVRPGSPMQAFTATLQKWPTRNRALCEYQASDAASISDGRSAGSADEG